MACAGWTSLCNQTAFIHLPSSSYTSGPRSFQNTFKKISGNLAVDSTNERDIYEITAPSAKVNRHRSLANGRHETL